MKVILRLTRPGLCSGSFSLLLFLSACTLSSPRMTEDQKGLFSFPEEVSCEPSGTVFDSGSFVFVNDKPIPGRSPVFRFLYRESRLQVDSRIDLVSPLFQKGRKWEGLAKSLDGEYLFATTAFDRSDPAFQHLAIWKSGRAENAVSCSDVIRKGLRSALGEPYFKVEGLSAYPSDPPLLLLGIRARGPHWKSASKVIEIVSFPCAMEEGECIVSPDSRIWFQSGPVGVPEEVGVSGLEYDPYWKRLYVLLSFEEPGGRSGGYLGILPEGATSLTLVRNGRGTAYRFRRKPEGVAVLDRDRILIVYDEDRTESDERRKNEAIFSIFRWE